MSPAHANAESHSIAWLKIYIEEPAFDLLGIKNTGRVKTLSVYFASIVLSLALAKSVSQNGIFDKTHFIRKRKNGRWSRRMKAY
jgi:hypothetical protein